MTRAQRNTRAEPHATPGSEPRLASSTTGPPSCSNCECTLCEVCALTRLRNVRPNCGGNFAHRPIRTRAQLAKHPASADARPVGIDEASHARFFERYRDVPIGER
ncbi:DUF1272 domain-containing protein [Paraburkholderia sp. 32]|uniref:DUF1272 domain-containing protein n=1 Tax=Paraburkholderia sp. 32 TaxID=2991057 RepID=UPI003D21A33A